MALLEPTRCARTLCSNAQRPIYTKVRDEMPDQVRPWALTVKNFADRRRLRDRRAEWKTVFCSAA